MLRRPRRSSFAEPLSKTLNWDVNIKPVMVLNQVLHDYQSIVRNDNGCVLNITKKSYHPASNERLLEIVSKIHEFTGFEVEGYSVFQEGRKVLAFLKNHEKMNIGGFDSTNYMVIGNSFDSSTGFFTGVSNVVTRCTNQFSQIKLNMNIRHTSQINMKLDDLVSFYRKFNQQEKELQRTFELWNGIRIDSSIANRFVNQVLDINSDEISTLMKNKRISLFNSINKEMLEMGSNMYGLFNGLTHYTTHVERTSSKVFGNSLGHTYQLNQKGFQSLKSMEGLSGFYRANGSQLVIG